MRRIKRAGKATHLPPSACPACGHTLYGTVAINQDVKPRPGDLSVCGRCASFLKITDDFGYRLITYDEIVDLEAEQRSMLIEMREMVHLMQKLRDK